MPEYLIKYRVDIRGERRITSYSAEEARRACAGLLEKELGSHRHSAHVTCTETHQLPETYPVWVIKLPSGTFEVYEDQDVWERELNDCYGPKYRGQMSRRYEVPVALSPTDLLGLLASFSLWSADLPKVRQTLLDAANLKKENEG